MKRWLLKVIAIRVRLIRNKKSYKNDAQLRADIDFLKRHIEANNYNNQQLIGFFHRHKERILNILPGIESKCGKCLHQQFYDYLSLAK